MFICDYLFLKVDDLLWGKFFCIVGRFVVINVFVKKKVLLVKLIDKFNDYIVFFKMVWLNEEEIE